MKILRYATLISPFLLIVVGCSSTSDTQVFEDRKYEYKKGSGIGKDLEVPPDLTKATLGNTLRLPGSSLGDGVSLTSFDEQQNARNSVTGVTGSVLPQIQGMVVKRDGDQRWLEVNSSPADVWPVVVAFWQENGILLVEQDPALGVMSTDWIENRADIANDYITDKIRGVFDGLYGASTRDQYRVRLEDGAKAGTTELFLTHRGVEQEFITGSDGNTEQGVWKPRKTDHDAEAEMMRRLMIYMGISEQQATDRLAQSGKKKSRATIVKSDGNLRLEISEELKRGWRLVGVALDRVGFLVEDRNRDENYYLVRYDDPLKGQQKKGMLSKLAFWSDDKADENTLYRIQLNGQSKGTVITVGNEAGKALSSKTAERMLTLIHEQIN